MSHPRSALDLMPEVFRQEQILIVPLYGVLVASPEQTLEQCYARGLALATIALRYIYNVGLVAGEHPLDVDDFAHDVLAYLHNQVCGIGLK